MAVSVENEKPFYSFLSIGPRGVGKTVFLTACYLECHRDSSQQRLLWFDCEDREVRRTIDNVLIYVAKTGEYPPATLKIANFDFCLKQRHQWGNQTLAHVRWWDVPGEVCQVTNPAFTNLLTRCDGCCLFLDASLLVQLASDRSRLNRLLQPFEALGEWLVHQELTLPLALVLTKCDQLSPHPLPWQRLQQGLHPLLTRFQTWQLPHQVFYSEIPIVEVEGLKTLQLSRVGTPIYWLFSQIHRLQHPNADSSLHPEPESSTEGYYLPTPPPRWLPQGLGQWIAQLSETSAARQSRLLVLLVLLGLLSGGLGLAVYYNIERSLLRPSPEQTR